VSSDMSESRVTVVVPSLNQGRFLDEALASIFSQSIPMEVMVLDGGSTDNSISVIEKWGPRVTHWRSGPDAGQAAAINEGVALGKAPFVCWLNADDLFLPGGLRTLLAALESSSEAAAYGRCWTVSEKGTRLIPYLTLPFHPVLFSSYCFVAQPATLIRRSAWERVGGLDEGLHMAMDYDLWWRLYRSFGRPAYVRKFVAATRMHGATKTALYRRLHYAESMQVVRRHTGRLPLKWRVSWPFMVSLRAAFRRRKLSS
jgi:glycosyltransferase involved in cell wall biosynthesis